MKWMPLPLEQVIADARRSIDAQLYYPALLVTLTIPDICMGLTLDKNVFVKQKHYIDFVDTYTTQRELGIGGAGCFQLRGGLVHKGDLRSHPFFGITHVIFTVPHSPLKLHAFNMVHEAQDKSAAMLDLGLFCEAMFEAARRWAAKHESDPKVQANLKNLIRFCPDGLPPFVVGNPVVASGV